MQSGANFATAANPSERPPRAIVVLGCRLRFVEETQVNEFSRLFGAAARRAARGAEAWHADPTELIVVSGGRAWDGVVEADAMARTVEAHGVPTRTILRERWSHTTRDNARFVAELLRTRAIEHVELVTCAFHMPRARLLFEHHGFQVTAAPAPPLPRVHRSAITIALEAARERIARAIDDRLVLASLASSRGHR